MWNYCMMALTVQVLVLGSSKNTANRERPARPNTCGFSLMKFLWYCENLAQQIPPCLRYSGTLPKVGLIQHIIHITAVWYDNSSLSENDGRMMEEGTQLVDMTGLFLLDAFLF